MEDGGEDISVEELEQRENELATLCRQYFEANFEPLPPLQLSGSTDVTLASQDASTDDETDWEGLSDQDDGLAKVIDYSAAKEGESGLSRDEFKSFMVVRPFLRFTTFV